MAQYTSSEKLDFLLSICFMKQPKELSFEISESLLVKEDMQLIKSAESLKGFISIPDTRHKIVLHRFNKDFVIDNHKNSTIKDFLISKLSEFEHFDWGTDKYANDWRIHWVLKHKGETVGSFSWKRVIGHESYKDWCYAYSSEMLYHAGYENSRKEMKKHGIYVEGGGSVYEYQAKGIVDLKPHILELLDYLKSV